MLSGLMRFFLLVVFVFVAACAGDAAPPMTVTNNGINTKLDADLSDDIGISDTDPSDQDTDPSGHDTDPSDHDTENLEDTEIQHDTEIPEDTDPPTPPCTAHTECEAEELCLLNPDNGELQCTVPTDCDADTDCSAPEICAFDYNLDTLRTVCLEPNAPAELGDFCTDDSECASNLCLNEQCATPCMRHDDCSADGSFLCTPQQIEHAATTETINVCTPRPPTQCTSDNDCASPERCVLKSSADGASFGCALPPPGGQEPGAACAINTDCASNLCLDNLCMSPCTGDHHCDVDAGHTCDVVPVMHNGNAANVSICQPPVECERDGQCALDEVCYIRKTNSEVQTHCKPPNPDGETTVGAACTTDENCASNLCLQGRFHKHCAPACTTDAHCAAPGSPVQYECKSVDFTLTNGSDSAKVCVAKAPPACLSQANCAAGTYCAVVTNAAHNALETVCIPVAGGRAPGAACTADDQCNGQLCLNGTCSQPCNARNQCGSQQLCRNNNVQKSGFTQSFQVCETPPDIPCTSVTQCTQSGDVRICADVRTVNGTTQGYCSFPNPGGEPIATACTDGSQCSSNFCLSFTNQCTQFCTNNGHCGSGNNICTTYAGLGICATSCTSNSSCLAGQSCTINENSNTNSADYVCEKHAGDGLLGADPATVNGCQSGFTLTITQGSTVTSYCSVTCATNADCTGGIPGNTLTTCKPVNMTLSNGSTTTVSMCSRP